ncbi:ribbon-helix-helix protein, CopG family [Nostoc punctiforme FACHB-252]|uniref:Ribbon-helix-helix protein, CopG family n=1 Tax=Nostoc punctiforme FACHB-252 TaxID=1357509 RepID=A0ABR8HMY8_NOSPU|nr:ribbon-helix-helix protein, CopG family [Nostoc punctiforme]MBD2616468.1 ribbon-helix-helix protein, CopG family [Nostoc punctiforme FACHB-252]
MNKKWAVKRITINLATSEMEKLQEYCQKTGRPATDVIRELIRSLETNSSIDLAENAIQPEKLTTHYGKLLNCLK